MSSGQLSVNKEIMKHQLLLLNDQKDHLISSDLIIIVYLSTSG
jgi:hypothetical protein